MKIIDGKPVYENGEEVEVAVGGDTNFIIHGTIVGIASKHIMDTWIVLVNASEREKLKPEYSYDAMVAFHPIIRPSGSNEPFWCEKTKLVD